MSSKAIYAIQGPVSVNQARRGPPQAGRAGAPPLCDRHGLRIQYDLSPREIQVLRLIKEGASNPEISAALNISPHTVKSHVVHIFNKLNENDRTQAAAGDLRFDRGSVHRCRLLRQSFASYM
jgi:DNA-binding NarL/FixJ family response regulator